jgi:hypothetical protein
MKSTTDKIPPAKARSSKGLKDANGAKDQMPSGDLDEAGASSPKAVSRKAGQARASDAAKEAQPKPAANAWPFAPGTQGDQQPLAVKPVQKAGWNARQFRI